MEAYVIRAQAIGPVLDHLAQFEAEFEAEVEAEVAALPRRDAMFSVVVDAHGIALWSAEATAPFLMLQWSSIGVITLHSYLDYPLYDLLAIYGGRTTTVLSLPVDGPSGGRTLELALWGDDAHDQTESLLDEYGLRTALARIERVRRGTAAAERALPSAAITITRLPRFTLRRR
ncbi:hypothetical protein BH11ACT2_BH11ACT2_12560 [soil metagenome]